MPEKLHRKGENLIPKKKVVTEIADTERGKTLKKSTDYIVELKKRGTFSDQTFKKSNRMKKEEKSD